LACDILLFVRSGGEHPALARGDSCEEMPRAVNLAAWVAEGALMLVRRNLFMTVVIAIVGLASAGASEAGEPPIGTRLYVHKQTVVEGEPVFCGPIMINRTNRVVTFNSAGGLGYGHGAAGPNRVMMQIAAPGADGGFSDYWPLTQDVNPINAVPLKVPPEHGYGFRHIVLSSDGKLALPAPGQYKLQVSFATAGERHRSSPLPVTVRKPQDPVDKAAWAELQAMKKAYFALVHAPWAHGPPLGVTEKERKRLEKVAQSHAASVYAPYLQFSLGRCYKFLAKEAHPQQKKQAQQHKQKALKLFKAARARASDFKSAMFERFIISEMQETSALFEPLPWPVGEIDAASSVAGGPER
jgi:hypothetical protein